MVTVYSVTLTWSHVVLVVMVSTVEAPDSEMRLPFSTDASADIYEVHGPQRIDLRCRNNADMPSGIYRCRIATNAVHDDVDIISVRESVYVELYACRGNQKYIHIIVLLPYID